MKALIISADHFEDSELLFPFYRLQEEGVDVYIASIARGKITGKHGYEVVVDTALRDVDPKEYDMLILPGGKAPTKLRKEPLVITIAQDFMRRNKPVAVICHGPQILITADVLQGRRATCYHSVAEELQGSGALYEDAEVVVDDNLITSRQPSDLPAFMRKIVKLLRKTAQ